MTSASPFSHPASNPACGAGWFAELPCNADPDARHQINVEPNADDMDGAAWERVQDNTNVVKLREYLKQNNGIKGLELCYPHEVKKAAKLFHRDGFVAVRDALSPEILAEMRATTDRAMMAAIESGPPPPVDALPLGRCSWPDGCVWGGATRTHTRSHTRGPQHND